MKQSHRRETENQPNKSEPQQNRTTKTVEQRKKSNRQSENVVSSLSVNVLLIEARAKHFFSSLACDTKAKISVWKATNVQRN